MTASNAATGDGWRETGNGLLNTQLFRFDLRVLFVIFLFFGFFRAADFIIIFPSERISAFPKGRTVYLLSSTEYRREDIDAKRQQKRRRRQRKAGNFPMAFLTMCIYLLCLRLRLRLFECAWNFTAAAVIGAFERIVFCTHLLVRVSGPSYGRQKLFS